MRRYLSIGSADPPPTSSSDDKDTPHLIITNAEPSQDPSSHSGATSLDTSTTALLSPPALAPPQLKVKRVDYYYSWWSKAWKYRDTGDKVTPERAPTGAAANDAWGAFCFVVVRTFPQEKGKEDAEPTFRVVLKSPYLLKACEAVIERYPGLSWNVEPVTLEPQLLVTYLPLFEEYRDALQKKQRTLEEDYTLSSVDVLVDYLRQEYHNTLSTLARLTAYGEMTFDLIDMLFTPRSILLTTCPTTGAPRAVQLMSVRKIVVDAESGRGVYELLCESIDVADDGAQAAVRGRKRVPAQGVPTAGGGRSFGRVSHRVVIPYFQGTMRITELDAFPIQYVENADALKAALVARGRQWAGFRGIHHVQYDGQAIRAVPMGGFKRLVKYNVASRIMIDRDNFRRLNPNYEMPRLKAELPNAGPMPHELPIIIHSPERVHVGGPPDPPSMPHAVSPAVLNAFTSGVPLLNPDGNSKFKPHKEELSDEDLMLASPVVYGFSLTDKLWLEFNIEHVSEISWNDEAFANLVLPRDRKTLLRSLVEAHGANMDFDDFVQGKGHGLVVNLFGPPGVGKTMSAEATSEHVRRPLYVVGGGDLGGNAAELDTTLQRVFDIATSWQALVLIDEADVFLEQRSLHDLARNAMVAVFLRHLEYYRGILFLTTNRVRTFDEAFLSRIHVALHFRDLSPEARRQVWTAFLRRVGVSVGTAEDVTDEGMESLAARAVNGRQIKNATRTACSLATARGEKLQLSHLIETLDAMDEFTAEFRGMGTA